MLDTDTTSQAHLEATTSSAQAKPGGMGSELDDSQAALVGLFGCLNAGIYEAFHLFKTCQLTATAVQDSIGEHTACYGKMIEVSIGKEAWQNYLMDSSLCRLPVDPRQTYRWYARQVDEAIRYRELKLAKRLHNEALILLNSPKAVDQQLLDDMPRLNAQIACDEKVRQLKCLMSEGEYKDAVLFGEEVRRELASPSYTNRSYFLVARADLDVYYAQALIYTSAADEGITVLKEIIAEMEGERKPENVAWQSDPHTFDGWRRNLVLGRAHNNLGYAYWMHLGHYEEALKQFRSALPYFRASELWEEMANTNDNMGRVYALRRHPTRAETLVDEGLRLRQRLGRDYRIGLSLNSRAIVHLEFEEPHRARRLSERALSIFEGLEAQRGIGLASITLGRSLRHLGWLWTEGLYSFEDCERFFSEGAQHLNRAVGIFEHVVDEPVRLVEALNELGCTYRERSRLAQEMAPASPLARTIAAEAIKILGRCIELTDKYTFPASYIDSCEDLAQIYFLRRDYDNTDVCLQRAEERVPEEYKLREGGLQTEIPEEKRIEAFWLQMGKIKLLRGSLAFDLGTDGGSRPATHEVLQETAQHYLLSAAYFEQYSDRAVGIRATSRQIYDRFKHCTPDELQYLREEALPKIVDKYDIDLSRLGPFFEDTLGLVIEVL